MPLYNGLYLKVLLVSKIWKWYGRLGVLVVRAHAQSVEVRGSESPVVSSQRLKNRHMLLPWLSFTI